MKKAIVLILLLALPVTAYIILASAAHNFAYLPTLTKDISNLNSFENTKKDSLSFDGKNTVLCFFGNDISRMQGNAYNLHEKIYKDNLKYKDFQIIVLAEQGTEKQAEKLKNKLNEFTGVNMMKWNFAFGDSTDIQNTFNSLKTKLTLDKHNSTPYVFVVDQEGNLRGREEEDEAEKGTKDYGYDTRSIAALNNTLVDDFKVLLAEYRLKLKKNEDDITIFKKEQ